MPMQRRETAACRSPEPSVPTSPEALKQVNTRIPASLARRIKIHAVREGQTTQALIAQILAQYLAGVGDMGDRPANEFAAE